MPVATALVSGNDPTPQLAEQAVRRALLQAGTDSANGVLLFLTPEFTRHAQPAVLAAARAAQCMQVFGSIAAGLCTELEWVLDRPAAAAMVLSGQLSLGNSDPDDSSPLLCCTSTPFPSEWKSSRRFGLHFHGSAGQSAVWQAARVADQGGVDTHVRGARADLVVSPGLQPIDDPRPITAVRGFDLVSIAGEAAVDALLRVLPAEWRERKPLPLHLLNACVTDGAGETRNAAIISVNADRSLTMTEPFAPGSRLCWAIRQPQGAEAETRDRLAHLPPTQPDFALYFSCIGRGPYFYGNEDRDLIALTERFPGMPLIGAYGTGQIAFHGDSSRQLQNAVVAAVFNEVPHVQS